jgi:retron-type reverse transcriptase
MTAWRTHPDQPLSSARHLAEKYKDLGWRRLYRSEQKRICKYPDEICEHLAPHDINALVKILDIIPPVRKSKAPLPSRGKDALMEKIRAAHRASREIGNQ